MRTVLQILRDLATPHDPETGEVLEGQQAPPKPERAPSAAQEAIASKRRLRGKTRGEGPAPEPIVAGSYRDALRGMVDRPFLGSQKHQEQHWRADRAGAHPDLIEFERAFLRKLAKLGVPMFASEVLRDGKRQDELFAQGVSKAKAGKSPHQYGCAIDLVHGVKGWDLTETQWGLIGHQGKELAAQRGIKLVWGGDFKALWDPAHWEIANWREIKQVLDDSDIDGDRLTAESLVVGERERAQRERWEAKKEGRPVRFKSRW